LADSAVSAQDVVEDFRKADLRLRLLLFGDGAVTPPLVKGEVPRQRVTSEIKHLRAAFDRLVERERASRSEVADAARALESELTQRAAVQAAAERKAERPPLVTPAEAAKVLGMSSSSVYRAIRNGTLEAATPVGVPVRVSSAEVLRLLAERRSG
jgi:excisionase family DNA binding protein